MTPSSIYRPSLLSILLVACLLAVPSLASADIIPQRIASCYNADEGDKCSSARGSTRRGTCVLSPCRGKDYSNGSPPEYYYYACLKCLTRNQREDLKDRIEAGQTRDPADLPQSKREAPDNGIEIITGDDGPEHFDPPDIADDDDDDDNPSADDSDHASTDAGISEPVESSTEADAGSTDQIAEPDASSSKSLPASKTPTKPTSSNEPESREDAPADDVISTSTLVTTGSIGLGLLLVALGFRNRRRSN